MSNACDAAVLECHHSVRLGFLQPLPSAEEIPACTQAGCSATGPERSVVHCLLGWARSDWALCTS